MQASVTTHLHGFCDASIKAYAAVVYICTKNTHGHFTSALVTAKTRVAPSRVDKDGNPTTTIPRLELCAAELLADVIGHVRCALDLAHTPCTLWSDSTIVLSWLRKSTATLKPYAANRIGYIQRTTDVADWRHVRTHLNPADCASRGISAEALIGHNLWWHGPTDLMQNHIDTDIPSPSDADVEAMAAETKPIKVHIARASPPNHIRTHFVRDGEAIHIDLVDRFATIGRLLRSTAYVLRCNPARRQETGERIVCAHCP